MNRSSNLTAGAGFTIIEMVVALLIMVVGVLGLAGTASVVSSMVGEGAQQSLVATVVHNRFEVIRSLQCGAVAGGSATTRGIAESWSLTPAGSSMLDLVDSVTYARRRGRKSSSFRSYVTC